MSKIQIYIVSVSSPEWDGVEVYTFSSREARSRFISAELEKVHDTADRDPRITWVTAQDTVDEAKRQLAQEEKHGRGEAARFERDLRIVGGSEL